jgi:hypothetical protein
MDREAMAAVGLRAAERGILTAIRRGLCRDEARELAHDFAVDRIVKGLNGSWDAERCTWERWAFYAGFQGAREAFRTWRKQGARHGSDVRIEDYDCPTTHEPPCIAREEIERHILWHLWPEERRMVRLWAEGSHYAEIARIEGVSPAFVTVRFQKLITKLRNKYRWAQR